MHARLARHPDTAVALDITEHDAVAARRRAGAALLDAWPRARGIAGARGIALALARTRLARGDAATPLPPLAALWAGWRGARG